MARTPHRDASDRVSLAACTITDHQLVDHLTGERHELNPAAVQVLRDLDGNRSLGAVALAVAARHQIDPAEAERDLRRFVDTLEAAGLVRVRRPWHPLWHPLLAVTALNAPAGLPARRNRGVPRRYPPTLRGCAAGAARAGGSVVLAAVPASIVMAVVVARFGAGAPPAVAVAPLILVLIAVLSVAAHEAGHLVAVRGVGGRAVFVAATTHQVAVTHDVTDPGRRRCVALAGPVAGAGLALSAWPVLAALPRPIDGLTGPAAALLAGGHLASLLPWFADGRHLWGAGR